MADRLLGSRAGLLLALLASACGGSSEGAGTGGGSSTTGPGKGAAGAGVASGGMSASNPNGASGSGASGAGNAPGSTSSSCHAITPCGGDVVGDWTIKEMCLTTSAMEQISKVCPGATLTLSPFTATGTLSFKADNTMTSAAVISFKESVLYPASCFDEAECTAIDSQLSSAAGVTEGHCTFDAAAGCSCSVSSTQSTMSSGTYQVQGNNLTTTNDGGTAEVDTFCVSGNTLSIYGVSDNGTSASMVLTK